MIGRGKGDKKEGRGLKALSKYYYSKSHFQLKCVAQTLKINDMNQFLEQNLAIKISMSFLKLQGAP